MLGLLVKLTAEPRISSIDNLSIHHSCLVLRRQPLNYLNISREVVGMPLANCTQRYCSCFDRSYFRSDCCLLISYMLELPVIKKKLVFSSLLLIILNVSCSKDEDMSDQESDDQVEVTNGIDGQDGQDGANGQDGSNGIDGLAGKSAYEIWLELGNEGTEEDFLNSLKVEADALESTVENLEAQLDNLEQEFCEYKNEVFLDDKCYGNSGFLPVSFASNDVNSSVFNPYAGHYVRSETLDLNFPSFEANLDDFDNLVLQIEPGSGLRVYASVPENTNASQFHVDVIWRTGGAVNGPVSTQVKYSFEGLQGVEPALGSDYTYIRQNGNQISLRLFFTYSESFSFDRFTMVVEGDFNDNGLKSYSLQSQKVGVVSNFSTQEDSDEASAGLVIQ